MANQARYGNIAIILHWLIALLLFGQIAGGYVMRQAVADGSNLQFELFQWHKSFGLAILLLSVVRLGWRLTHRQPGLPVGMRAWEKAAARFASDDVRKTGEGEYVANGRLTLRDVTQVVVLPFTLDIDGREGRAIAAVPLMRNNYGVGRGEFATDEWVAYDVQVNIEITALCCQFEN